MDIYSKPWACKAAAAAKAEDWVSEIKALYSEDITQQIQNTTRYTGEELFHRVGTGTTEFTFLNLDTVQAIQETYDLGKRICVLNFASYKNPGGAFLKGSLAQEEALCHQSTLFPVLSAFKGCHYDVNSRQLNRGMYTNTALYSEDVLFFSEDESSFLVDVLTCAAPNWSVGLLYGKFSEGENNAALSSRVEFIYNILLKRNVDLFITGAWGCGVFKQDAKVVAECMLRLAKQQHPCKQMVFAVPGSNANARTFRKAIEEV